MPPVLSKKSAPTLPEKKIYYLKLLKLCVEVGIPVLKDVFDVIHLPTNLPGVLSTPKVQKELRQLQKKNVLHQSQIDILILARKGSVTSAAFDISLLIVLLRNFCNITSSPTDAVWNSEPSTADKSKAADIVRIRLCRNNLYHRTNLAVTESDFEKKWNEIKDALIRLGGGTKYEEDIHDIKVGSVDPEIEEHYHDLLRSREEAERKTEETLDNLKTGQQDLKQKLDEIGEKLVYAEIIIKITFKLLAAGAVTLGWAAGCTYFLNRYKDDPETVTGLVQRAIIPATLAMGATVVGILRGSIIIKVKVTSLAALDYLWKSCNDGGEMEQNLYEVIVTDGLIQQALPGTDSVGISVTMSEDDYRRARDTLMGDCRSIIPSHRKRDKNLEKDEDRDQMMPKKSAPLLTQERINYLKLCKLLIEVGRPVLQDVFDAIHLPTNLPCVLSTPKVQNELRQLQKKNVFYQSQMDILNFARKGSVTSAVFDSSLLIVLLRNFCNITSSPTDAVWNSEPSTADKSKAADIVRIRLCRNDLFHCTNRAFTESDFEKKWDEINDALIRLGGGTKYQEDIQNIKFGSVDPEMEQHYHNLLRSREEAEKQQAEDINYIKTEVKDVKTEDKDVKSEIKDVKQKLDESETSVTIDIKTKFKLLAAGAVTIGWAAGCTYFLNRYKDDPETVTGLIQRAIIPATLAMGATVVGILRGSIIIKVKVTSLAALDYLWKSCDDGGEMEQNLHKVIVTDELSQKAPLGTDSVGISVTMSKDDYRRARDTLMGDCHRNIPSHDKKYKREKNDVLSVKRMRNDQTQPTSTDKSRKVDKASHLNEFAIVDKQVQGATSGQLEIGKLLGWAPFYQLMRYLKPTKYPLFEFKDEGRKIKRWDKSTRDEWKSAINSFDALPQFNSPTFNIILTGQVRSGKTSFLNSINSIFRGSIRPREKRNSFTKTLNMYPLKHNPRIRIGDTIGIEAQTSDTDIRNILSIEDGHVPIGHKFNWGEEFLPSSSEYIPNPEPKDRAHCIALVINAKDISKKVEMEYLLLFY